MDEVEHGYEDDLEAHRVATMPYRCHHLQGH
jgi:hypothetical protein